MIRLFVALRPDTDTRRLLCGLGSSIPGARTVPEEQLHLTLRFIGEVDGAMLHDIRNNLSSIIAPPITMSVRGVGHFPPRGTPRVLWAGVEPAGDVIILRNKVNRTLYECGIAPEQRKFHSHITLARLNNSPTVRVARFLAGNSLLQTPQFTVDLLTLFSSTLSPKGAIHTVEAEYQLQTV